MKKSLLLLSAIILIVSSCVAQPFKIRGNGNVARGEFDIPLDYSSLSVQEGIRVVLVPSDRPIGRIEADEEVMEYVSIVEAGGRVKVSYDPFIAVNSSVKTVVTMPVSGVLSYVGVSSAGKVECATALRPERLEVDGSSAGHVELTVEGGQLYVDLSSAAAFNMRGNVERLDVEASSAANFRGIGRADNLSVDVSSAASFKGYELVARIADVEASSGASVQFTVTEELNADASSGGSVKYMGTPERVSRDASSGGSVRSAD